MRFNPASSGSLVRSTTVFLSAVLLVAVAQLAQAQSGSLFDNTDALMRTAKEAQAELLSPGNYADAQKAYEKAQAQAAKGRSDKAAKDLKDADASLRAAIDASKIGVVSFADTLKARDLALAAEAPEYESEAWEKAEAQFNRAARTLEKGNVNKAADESATAAGLYNDAELAAIKTAIVGQARELIAKADDDKVEREAPETLKKAKDAVSAAEQSLDGNRYATAGPIELAATAEYEAQHAMYLAGEVRKVKDKDQTVEGLILAWEQPLQNIAAALDVTTDMSNGYEKSASAAVDRATLLRNQNETLSARVDELEIELGGTELIVEETKRLQAQLNEVESMYKPGEAQVLREKDDIVLRLVGLSFPTGQSVIQTQYFGLLKKVQETIAIFPDSKIIIEGHTDSSGSDAVNMKLSQDRADAVREYLIANMGLPESRISSIGYGKDKPIASNETDAGRAQNRRIDVVIKDARARRGQ